MDMAATKVTFTLDAQSLGLLAEAAARLSMPKSEVVREAILEFHDRIGRLSERERAALLRVFDDLVPRIPLRDESQVEGEIGEIRKARRTGGRRALSKAKS